MRRKYGLLNTADVKVIDLMGFIRESKLQDMEA